MELINEIHRLNTLHQLIKMCKTGSPDELAQRLHVSKRHLYNVLDNLRALGTKIDYSRSDYTFYYTNSFELNLNLQVEYLDGMIKNVFLQVVFLDNAMFVHGRPRDGKGSHYLYITINDDAKRQNGHKGKDIYRVLSIAEILKYS